MRIIIATTKIILKVRSLSVKWIPELIRSQIRISGSADVRNLPEQQLLFAA